MSFKQARYIKDGLKDPYYNVFRYKSVIAAWNKYESMGRYAFSHAGKYLQRQLQKGPGGLAAICGELDALDWSRINFMDS